MILYGVGSHYYKADRKSAPAPLEKSEYRRHLSERNVSHWREELARIDTPEYAYDYILRVIEHGSEGLGFPGGVMEGGYVSKEEAPKIACYVLELGGHRCPHPYPKEAEMFFSSVCAGCHGNDGKGINGTYPDLTRHKLLGIEKREEFLRRMLNDE